MKEVRKISQCERIREIIKSNQLTQRKFAETIKVTESYVSMILKDDTINISLQLLELIEKIYGYRANWIVNGEDPKFSQVSKDANVPETNRKLVSMIEHLTEEQSKAVMAFVNSLEEIEKAIKPEPIRIERCNELTSEQQNRINTKTESYRRELADEEKGAGELSASQMQEENVI